METAKAGEVLGKMVRNKWFWIILVIIIILIIVYRKGKKSGASENELAGAYGSTTADGFDPRPNINKLADAIQDSDFSAVDKQAGIIAGWGTQQIKDGADWWRNKYEAAYGSLSEVLKKLSSVGVLAYRNIEVLYKKLDDLGL